MEVERSFESHEDFKNPQDYNSQTLAYYDFDSLNAERIDPTKLDTMHRLSGMHAYKMKGTDEWGPMFKIRYDRLVPENRDHAWIRVTINYFSAEDIKENPASVVINMPHRDYNLKYHSFNFDMEPSQKGKWNKVVFDYMTPFPYSEKDRFDIYIWHRGKSDLYLDDWKIESFLKKD